LLGSDDVKSDVFRHQVEIRVVVDDLQAVLGAECAISVPPHFCEIALPGDFAPECAELFLAIHLDQQAQPRFDGRTLCAAAAGTQGSGYQLVINDHVRSHETFPVCALTIHIMVPLVKPPSGLPRNQLYCLSLKT